MIPACCCSHNVHATCYLPSDASLKENDFAESTLEIEVSMETEHANIQPLSLQLLVGISETLASMVQGMLGPCGQLTLLSTNTGKALITRDGRMVLLSLQLAHPVACCIKDSLHLYHSAHQDGSKTFILYLAHIMKAIHQEAELEGCDKQAQQFFRMKLSRELNLFLCEDFEQILKLFIRKLMSCSSGHDSGDGFLLKAKVIFQTSLFTCLQKHSVDFFAELLSSFLCLENQTPHTCRLHLAHVLQHFDMYHTKLPTQPHQKSKTFQGILLETDLQPLFQHHTHNMNSQKKKRFALMDIDFDDDEKQGDGNAVHFKASSPKLLDLFYYKRNSLKKLLTHLKINGLDVLLSSERVPQYVAGICKEEGVAVHSLGADKLCFLKELTGVDILKHLNQEGLNRCVFTASVNSFVRIGSRFHTLIQLGEEHGLVSPVNHIVLCAPTEGVCDQLCHSVYKALKTLHLCLDTSDVRFQFHCENGKFASTDVNNSFQSHTYSLTTDDYAVPQDSTLPSSNKFSLTISSGGVFEAALFSTITDFYASHSSFSDKKIGALVQKMLMAVPRTLHTNLCSSKHGEQRQFTEKWTRMICMVQEGVLVGLDHHGDVAECSHLEPVLNKLSLVTHVVQLVVQLLRVEAIVPVTKIPVYGSKSDDDDRDEDKIS